MELTLSPDLARLLYLIAYALFFHLPLIALCLLCWLPLWAS